MDRDSATTPELGDNAKEHDPALSLAHEFSPEKKQHVALMRRIAQQITKETGDNFVLKGGTALLLAYGLPRYSTDLDFDGKRSATDLRRSIERGTQAVHMDVVSLSVKKDTSTTKRYMLRYSGALQARPLKIEASFRQAEEIDEADITVVNDLRVYKIERLARLKIEAFLDRTAARDIFDVWFLLRKYPEALANDQLGAICARVQEMGIDFLRSTMADDVILAAYDLDLVALELVDEAKGRWDARKSGS